MKKSVLIFIAGLLIFIIGLIILIFESEPYKGASIVLLLGFLIMLVAIIILASDYDKSGSLLQYIQI